MRVQLLNGDCLAVMPTLPTGGIDMVLTDLPYGTTQSAWDAVIPFGPLWSELERLCPLGAIVLFAAQPFTSALVMSRVERFRHEWVWRKNKVSGHLNAKRRPLRQHEDILVFGSTDLPYTPQMSEGHEPGHAAMRRTPTTCYGAQRATSYGGQTTRYPVSVLDVDVVNNDDPFRGHPNQKPVELLANLIRTYSLPGQTVLDCTMGSGSTGEACRLTGRAFVGIERDPEFFAFAERRLTGPPLSRAEATRQRLSRRSRRPVDDDTLFGKLEDPAK